MSQEPEMVTKPTIEQLLEHHRGLREYNAQFVQGDFTPVQVVMVAKDGKVVAGLDGEINWGKLHVENVWVHPELRGSGRGTQLMRYAEDQARAHGCHSVVLDTFSFQARGFYEKLGYREFGAAAAYDGGHTRHYFEKALDPGRDGFLDS